MNAGFSLAICSSEEGRILDDMGHRKVPVPGGHIGERDRSKAEPGRPENGDRLGNQLRQPAWSSPASNQKDGGWSRAWVSQA